MIVAISAIDAYVNGLLIGSLHSRLVSLFSLSGLLNWELQARDPKSQETIGN